MGANTIEKVAVTQDDIATAKQSDSAHCMISNAIKREHPDWKNVSTDLATIRYTGPDGRRRICLTPPPAQNRLLRFDQGDKTLGPFRFRLRAAQILPKREPGQRRRSQRQMGVKTEKRGRDDRARAPVVHGGKPLPVGPLASGKQGRKSATERKTGRIRRYGLKAMGV